MLIVVVFGCLLAVAAAIALSDWRRGWLMALIIGIVQDPVRKLTPGTPVVLTYAIVGVYFAVLAGANVTLQRQFRDFTRRFPRVCVALGILCVFFLLAAVNGLFTFGLGLWQVPALSLFIYLSPLPAVVLGYAYVRNEQDLVKLLTFYAVITTIALLGTPLEFFKLPWGALGMVALPEGFIRHLPGIQIRILSGFYRAPDIMGWHASMLTIIGLSLALRAKTVARAWPWLAVAAWGFLNCVMSGRRKAVYMVAVFAIVFVARYARRLTTAQVISFALAGVLVGAVMYRLSKNEESSVYTRGTVTSQAEVLERLEGGLRDTIEQSGIFGAGLGTATQGVRHLVENQQNLGWQEGGLGKLAVELGIPGLFAAVFFAWRAFRMMWRIASFSDEPDTSQLLRVSLVAIALANVAEFLVSAQAYTDAVLTLFTAFLIGCLFATAAFEDRRKVADAAPEAVALRPALA